MNLVGWPRERQPWSSATTTVTHCVCARRLAYWDWQNHAERFLGLFCQPFGSELDPAFKTARRLTDVPAQKLRFIEDFDNSGIEPEFLFVLAPKPAHARTNPVRRIKKDANKKLPQRYQIAP